jgi:hypothetical protein
VASMDGTVLPCQRPRRPARSGIVIAAPGNWFLPSLTLALTIPGCTPEYHQTRKLTNVVEARKKLLYGWMSPNLNRQRCYQLGGFPRCSRADVPSVKRRIRNRNMNVHELGNLIAISERGSGVSVYIH